MKIRVEYDAKEGRLREVVEDSSLGSIYLSDIADGSRGSGTGLYISSEDGQSERMFKDTRRAQKLGAPGVDPPSTRASLVLSQ